MTGRQQLMVVGAIIAVIGAGVWAGKSYLGDELAPVTVGSRAPAFSAVTLDVIPKTRTLADYKGQVILVNVWATWCAPCEKEMPMLQKLSQEYVGKGFHVVAVSVDAPGMEAPIRDFVKRYGLTFDVLYDAPGHIRTDYMTTGQPESFLIGKDGVIRFKKFAAIEEPDAVQIRTLIKELLTEPGS